MILSLSTTGLLLFIIVRASVWKTLGGVAMVQGGRKRWRKEEGREGGRVGEKQSCIRVMSN
jgi:hypothetical protein